MKPKKLQTWWGLDKVYNDLFLLSPSFMCTYIHVERKYIYYQLLWWGKKKHHKPALATNKQLTSNTDDIVSTYFKQWLVNHIYTTYSCFCSKSCWVKLPLKIIFPKNWAQTNYWKTKPNKIQRFMEGKTI